ncbi:MAG: YqgE/AlgH family protein [Bacteroidales bacterium]|nr:YqgE/AlgH family protein [Bacteroidales bacterium]
MTILPNIFKITQKIDPSAGRLLIAEPLLLDGIFARSVVLLTEHNDEGSLGYILNKNSGFTIQQLLPKFKNFYTPVFLGGPVATNTLHFIYRSKQALLNSKQIHDEIFWGGDIDELLKLMKNDIIKEKDIRFFIGYSGWGKNQLNEELSKHFWVVSKTDSEQVFEEDPKWLWKRSVILLDKKYHFWLNVPANPSLN